MDKLKQSKAPGLWGGYARCLQSESRYGTRPQNSDGSSIIEEELLASGPRPTVPRNVNDRLFLIGART